MYARILVAAFMITACAGPHPRRLATHEWLRDYVHSGRFTHGEPTNMTVLRDGKTVLFLRSPADSSRGSLWAHDVSAQTERQILTPEQAADAPLSAVETARQERLRMNSGGISGYAVSPDQSRVLVPGGGKLLVLELASGRLERLPTGDGAAWDARWSPDGKQVAYLKQDRVWTMRLGELPVAITPAPETGISYGVAELVAQEEISRFEGYWWSPQGTHLVVQRTDETAVDRIYIHDPAAPESEGQTQRYPRAGKKNATVTLQVYNLVDRALPPIEIAWDRERFPYLVTVAWPQAGALTIVVQTRLQDRVAVLAVDPATGVSRPLFEDTDAAYVNVDPAFPLWVGGSSFLWLSERLGYPRLELRGADGQLQRVLTPDGTTVTRVVGLSEDKAWVRFEALVDRIHQHVLEAALDGSGVRPVADTAGWHAATFGGDLGVIVGDPVEGKRTFGVRAGTVARGEIRSVANAAGPIPHRELLRVPGIATDLDAMVVWPRNLDPARKYPVLVYVYGGPTHRVVASPWRRALLFQWFADHGAILVAIDGRGTPGRGRDFERATVGDFTTIPLEDQVAGLTALGARFPEMDLDRVGIFGWSFGGTMTMMGVLQRPDVFRAGAAVASVTDWNLYDTHYTERYLGLPDKNRDGYRRSSPLFLADKLSRPLAILHGTVDDNVHAVNSFAMVDALFRAGRKHVFVPIAGAAHQVRDHDAEAAVWEHIAAFMDAHLHFEHVPEPPPLPAAAR